MIQDFRDWQVRIRQKAIEEQERIRLFGPTQEQVEVMKNKQIKEKERQLAANRESEREKELYKLEIPTNKDFVEEKLHIETNHEQGLCSKYNEEVVCCQKDLNNDPNSTNIRSDHGLEKVTQTRDEFIERKDEHYLGTESIEMAKNKLSVPGSSKNLQNFIPDQKMVLRPHMNTDIKQTDSVQASLKIYKERQMKEKETSTKAEVSQDVEVITKGDVIWNQDMDNFLTKCVHESLFDFLQVSHQLKQKYPEAKCIDEYDCRMRWNALDSYECARPTTIVSEIFFNGDGQQLSFTELIRRGSNIISIPSDFPAIDDIVDVEDSVLNINQIRSHIGVAS